MNKYTKDTLISDAMNLRTALIFSKYGMNCFNCSHNKEETIETGALIHDVNLDDLLFDLNRK